MLCLIFSLLTVAATGLLRGRNLIPLKEFLYLDSYNIIWKNKTRMLEWTLNLGWRKGGEPKSPQGDSEVAFLPIPDSKNYLIYISWRVHCWESSEERELSSYDLLLLRLLLSKKSHKSDTSNGGEEVTKAQRQPWHLSWTCNPCLKEMEQGMVL